MESAYEVAKRGRLYASECFQDKTWLANSNHNATATVKQCRVIEDEQKYWRRRRSP